MQISCSIIIKGKRKQSRRESTERRRKNPAKNFSEIRGKRKNGGLKPHMVLPVGMTNSEVGGCWGNSNGIFSFDMRATDSDRKGTFSVLLLYLLLILILPSI